MWQIYSPIDVGHQKKRLRLKKMTWELWALKKIAIGRDAEEGKHEFFIRREIKIIKIDGEALNGKHGSLFFTATPSSKTPCPPSLLHSSSCDIFPLTRCIAYLWSSSSITLINFIRTEITFLLPPISANLFYLQLPEQCLRYSRLII